MGKIIGHTKCRQHRKAKSVNTPKTYDYIVYVDGACSGSRSKNKNKDDSAPISMRKSGIGVIIIKDGIVIRQISEFIGKATSQIAEYRAIIKAMEVLISLKAESAIIRSDDNVTIEQINGTNKVVNTDLIALNIRASYLKHEIPTCDVVWITRSANILAHSLANSSIHTNGVMENGIG